MDREILERCRAAHRRMSELEKRLDGLTVLQAHRTRGSSSRSYDQTDTVFRFVDEKHNLMLDSAKALIEYSELFLQILTAVDCLPDLEAESLLAYCDEITNAKLAKKLGRSADYMAHVRRKAFLSFGKI